MKFGLPLFGVSLTRDNVLEWIKRFADEVIAKAS
jgi:hypothetical protein